MLKMPLSETQINVKSFRPPNFTASFQSTSSTSPGNSLLRSPTAAEASSTTRCHCTASQNKMLSLRLQPLQPWKNHLAKTYLLHQEYKNYFGNTCFYKWKREKSYLRDFYCHCHSLWSVPGVSSLMLLVLSHSRFMVIPSNQGIQGTCSGQGRCHLSSPLTFSGWVTCVKPSNCRSGYRPLNFSFARSGLVPPIT